MDDSKTKEKIEWPEDVELIQENLDQMCFWGKDTQKFSNTMIILSNFQPSYTFICHSN